MRKPKKKEKKRTRCVSCRNRRVCTYEKLVYEDGRDAGEGWCCKFCDWS